MRTYEFVIGSAEAGLRLDHYLTRRLPSGVSRAVIQRSIRLGLVTVGERPVKTHYKLRPRDIIRAAFTELPSQGGEAALRPQEIPLEIAYEDAQLLVVNKPAGLVTHPAPGHWDGTLVNAILWHLQQDGSAAGLTRAGIVHRLDKETSGLLLVAKTALAHTALSRQLKARTIHRRYLALVEGHLPLDTGTINAPIGRHQTHRKVMTIRSLGGRSAVTHYRVLARYPAAVLPAFTALELTLDTGRTHQIRVHLAHLGYPVIGDATYGKRGAGFWEPLGVTRQLLHARQLTFRHPGSQRELSVTAPLPEDLARWLDARTLHRFAKPA